MALFNRILLSFSGFYNKINFAAYWVNFKLKIGNFWTWLKTDSQENVFLEVPGNNS